MQAGPSLPMGFSFYSEAEKEARHTISAGQARDESAFRAWVIQMVDPLHCRNRGDKRLDLSVTRTKKCVEVGGGHGVFDPRLDPQQVLASGCVRGRRSVHLGAARPHPDRRRRRARVPSSHTGRTGVPRSGLLRTGSCTSNLNPRTEECPQHRISSSRAPHPAVPALHHHLLPTYRWPSTTVAIQLLLVGEL